MPTANLGINPTSLVNLSRIDYCDESIIFDWNIQAAAYAQIRRRHPERRSRRQSERWRLVRNLRPPQPSQQKKKGGIEETDERKGEIETEWYISQL